MRSCFLGLLLLLLSSLAFGQQIGTGTTVKQHLAKITWPQSTSTGTLSYNVYRSTTDGSGYVLIKTLPWQLNYYDDNTVVSGTTYYYVVTTVAVACDGNGLPVPCGESNFSSQGTAVVPVP